MAFNNVSVTTSATKIFSVDNRRVGFVISNNSNSDIYIGPDDTVTTSNGTVVPARGNFGEDGKFAWKGDVYGIAGSGTADIRYWDWQE